MNVQKTSTRFHVSASTYYWKFNFFLYCDNLHYCDDINDGTENEAFEVNVSSVSSGNILHIIYFQKSKFKTESKSWNNTSDNHVYYFDSISSFSNYDCKFPIVSIQTEKQKNADYVLGGCEICLLYHTDSTDSSGLQSKYRVLLFLLDSSIFQKQFKSKISECQICEQYLAKYYPFVALLFWICL